MYNLRTLMVMGSINVIIDDILVHSDDTLDDDCNSDSGTSRNMKKEKNKRRDEAVTWMEKVEDDVGINLEPSARVKLSHPLDQVIGDITKPMKTRRQVRNEVNYLYYTSLLKSKNMKEVLTDEHWITVMHQELGQFVRNDV